MAFAHRWEPPLRGVAPPHWLTMGLVQKNQATSSGPGAAVLATLRTLALNLLGLHGHHSVRAGLAPVAYEIAKLLAMAGIRRGWAT